MNWIRRNFSDSEADFFLAVYFVIGLLLVIALAVETFTGDRGGSSAGLTDDPSTVTLTVECTDNVQCLVSGEGVWLYDVDNDTGWWVPNEQ
jgi:hypothetical protein